MNKYPCELRARAALDNIVERLWRSVKYEEVYLKGYETVREAKESLARYFHFYNTERLHQALGYRTPQDVYFKERILRKGSETKTKPRQAPLPPHTTIFFVLTMGIGLDSL